MGLMLAGSLRHASWVAEHLPTVKRIILDNAGDRTETMLYSRRSVLAGTLIMDFATKQRPTLQPVPVDTRATTRSADELTAQAQRPGWQNLALAVQRTAENRTTAFQARMAASQPKPEPAPNRTGLPNQLKAGVEALSGTSLDGVRVHYNSARPAQLQACAFTQGSEIHVGPGQERHLPHEAWHAAQQRQGRVVPTAQLTGIALNTDARLEQEADVMGARALQVPQASVPRVDASPLASPTVSGPVQRFFDAPHPSEIAAAGDYVAHVRPDLMRTFDRIQQSDQPTDLYDWMDEWLQVNMHGVYDWEGGIVRGEPLDLDGEEVPGTRDIPELSDKELDEFRNGLEQAQYTHEQLVTLQQLLRERGAPHDGARRDILIDYHQRSFMHVEAEFSDGEGSGTDTDGSDSEDDAAYRQSDARRRETRLRLDREKGLLKPKLFSDRLSDLHGVMNGEGPSKPVAKANRDRKSTPKRPRSKDTIDKVSFEKGKPPAKTKRARSKDTIHDVIFDKGERPEKKAKLYRKETKFRYPGVKVGDRAKLPDKPTQQQTEDLALLNALLDSGVPIALAEQVVPSKFLVAQYRGLFYSRANFNQRSRAQHRGLDETNRPVFASAALAEGPLGTAGYYYLYGAGRQADLNTYQRLVTIEAQRIREALLALRNQQPREDTRLAAGRATGNFVPTSMSDIGTHFYSQNYDGYHNALADKLGRTQDEAQKPLDPLFEGLTNTANPKVSTGDVPTHAARYAFGLKPYKGHEHQILEPDYDREGKPKHPYSGRIYVSLHPLTDYGEDGPEQLIELQRQKRINIAQVILPERESPFEGMIGPGRVKHQLGAKFLNFNKEFKPVYAEKYGLDEHLFQAFRTALKETQPGHDERIFVEALLSNYLAMHSEIRAIEAATRIAAEQGGRLVYRNGSNAFGFEPAPIGGETAPVTKPTDMAALLDQLVIGMNEQAISLPSEEGVAARYGRRIRINGRGFACYIRSLVTAASRMELIAADDVEAMVDSVQDHLAAQGLRNFGQDIDAGGLVAAEARRALGALLHGFDPQVNIVMDRPGGGFTEFTANTGQHPVYLLYTPGHFDLLSGPQQ